MKHFILYLLFIIFIIIGCERNLVSQCEPEEIGSDINVPERVTFDDIQQTVFTPNCATSGCHSGNRPIAGLDLSAGKAYNNIVNVSSDQKSGLFLVFPGSSKDSYLIQKLRGTNTSVMPPGGSIDQALIDSLASWIDNGALLN